VLLRGHPRWDVVIQQLDWPGGPCGALNGERIHPVRGNSKTLVSRLFGKFRSICVNLLLLL
jgi:hypothetical protein